uniref:FGENESH: predicted gene_9.358 protein n=3 Tax=Rhodotorula toruloides TaxID=5286 RepID=A0A0K3CPN4_RHOTO
MSPYGGSISEPERTGGPLVPRTYKLANSQALTVFPVSRKTVPDELLAYLQGVFNDVVEEGRTYPQMNPLSLDEFAAYFFAADCFVGILDTAPAELGDASAGMDRDESLKLESVVAGREWRDCVLGMYYVKPNYPGRSSHLCNGGFVVPTVHRGLRVGSTLGRSYLHYAPLLGYRGSVFNLVYVSNVASVKIWDGLGFQRAGLIPGAGKLKGKDGAEDEYVDAIVYNYHDLHDSPMSSFESFPSFHTCRLDFSLSSLPSLPSYQLALVPFRLDASVAQKAEAQRLWWERRVQAESEGSVEFGVNEQQAVLRQLEEADTKLRLVKARGEEMKSVEVQTDKAVESEDSRKGKRKEREDDDEEQAHAERRRPAPRASTLSARLDKPATAAPASPSRSLRERLTPPQSESPPPEVAAPPGPHFDFLGPAGPPCPPDLHKHFSIVRLTNLPGHVTPLLLLEFMKRRSRNPFPRPLAMRKANTSGAFLVAFRSLEAAETALKRLNDQTLPLVKCKIRASIQPNNMTEFRSGSLSNEVQREWKKNARLPDTEWIGMSRPPGKGVKVSKGYQAEFERIDKLEKERKEEQKRKVGEAKRQREAEEQRSAEQRRQQQAPMSQTPDVPLFAVPDLDFPLDELEDLPAEQLFLVPFQPDASEEHRQCAYEIFWTRKEAAERAASGGPQEDGVGLQVGKVSAPWTGSHRRLSSIGDTEEGLPTPGGSQDGGAADFAGVVPAPGDQVETNHFNQPSGAASSSLAPATNSITDPSSDSAKSPFGAFPSQSSTRPLRKNGFYADAAPGGDAPSSSGAKQKKDKGKGKAVVLPEEAEEFSGTTTFKTTPSFSPSTSATPRATRSMDAKNSRWQRGPDRSIEVVVEIPLHPAMTNLSPALRKKLFGKKAASVKKPSGIKEKPSGKKEEAPATGASGTKRKTRSSMAAAERAEDEASERAAKKRKTSPASKGKEPARASTSTTARRGRSSTTSTASNSKRKTRRSSSAGFEVLIETPKRSTPLPKAASSIKGKGEGTVGTPSVRFTDNGDILVGSYHPTPQLSRSNTIMSAAEQEMLDTGNDIAVGPVASGSGLAPNDRSSTLAEGSSTAAADDDAELLAKILALTSENAAQAVPSTSSTPGLAKAAKEAHDGLFSGTDSPIDLDEATMAKILAAVESNPKKEQEKDAAEEEVDELDDDFGLAQLEDEFGIGSNGAGKGKNPVEPAVDIVKVDAPAPPPFATDSSTAPAASSSSAKPTPSRSQPAHSHRTQRATSATDDEDALVSPSLRIDGEGKKRRRKARMSGELERAVKRCASV